MQGAPPRGKPPAWNDGHGVQKLGEKMEFYDIKGLFQEERARLPLFEEKLEEFAPSTAAAQDKDLRALGANGSGGGRRDAD